MKTLSMAIPFNSENMIRFCVEKEGHMDIKFWRVTPWSLFFYFSRFHGSPDYFTPNKRQHTLCKGIVDHRKDFAGNK